MSRQAKLYFDKDFPFEIDQRSFSLNEVRRHTVSCVGKYDDLLSTKYHAGDNAPSMVKTAGFSQGLYIESYSVTKESGDRGIITFNLVETSNKSSPYAVSATVDLQQLEKALVSHPAFQASEVRKIIALWEATDESMRVYYKESELKFRYAEYTYDSQGAVESVKYTTIDNDDAIKYCKAVRAGVTNYLVYLPVIEVISQYLELPGVTQAENHKLSGTLNPEDIGKLGTFDNPPFSISGFDGGKWFKSVDRFVQNASGTWSRTEQWTYTNDLRFEWIYADKITTKVLESED